MKKNIKNITKYKIKFFKKIKKFLFYFIKFNKNILILKKKYLEDCTIKKSNK